MIVLFLTEAMAQSVCSRCFSFSRCVFLFLANRAADSTICLKNQIFITSVTTLIGATT